MQDRGDRRHPGTGPEALEVMLEARRRPQCRGDDFAGGAGEVLDFASLGTVVPLQAFARQFATANRLDVDQSRHRATSVTVE